VTRPAELIRVGGFVSLVAILAACATKNVATVADIPEALRAPGNQVMKLALHGSGVQIYECRASKDGPAKFAWGLRSPEADLSDHAGKLVGRHYAGPTWEANDGSEVTGEVVAQANAPDTEAIAWLLLRATSNAGKGLFGKTRFIQRVHTVGGKAPAGGCDATLVGKRVRVAYSADYYFYATRR
jgi:Protein of unknown function (DUF3455)